MLKVIFIMAHYVKGMEVTKGQLTVCEIMTKLIRAEHSGYGSLQMALLGEFEQS